jgi:tetratricopeptide (TPR) repeat protein
VALLRANQPQAALEAVQGTEKVFAEAGDFRRQGMALANQASALQALKRFKDAIEDFKKAGDALQKADEGDLRVEVMQLLAMLYLRNFKFIEAILALQSGLSGVKNPTPRQRLMKKILFIRL